MTNRLTKTEINTVSVRLKQKQKKESKTRRESRLIESPEVWIKHFPAQAKDRSLTSREGAYFASSRNKLEGEKPNK